MKYCSLSAVVLFFFITALRLKFTGLRSGKPLGLEVKILCFALKLQFVKFSTVSRESDHDSSAFTTHVPTAMDYMCLLLYYVLNLVFRWIVNSRVKFVFSF